MYNSNDHQNISENIVDNGAQENSSAEHQVTMIPIDELHPDENQPRKFKDGEKYLKGLTDNIKSCGDVYTPLQYRIAEGNKKYIVMGERRWRAAKAAGLTEILAMEYKGREDYRIAAYMDNQNRKKLLPMEEALHLKGLLDETNMEQRELAEKLNLSASRLSELLKIASLDTHIQEKALTGPEWTAQKLLELTKLENEEREFAFARMCKSHETTNSAVENENTNAATGDINAREITIPASYSIAQINKWKKSISTIRKKVTDAIPISLNKELIDSYQNRIEKYFQDIEATYAEMLAQLEGKKEISETTTKAENATSVSK